MDERLSRNHEKIASANISDSKLLYISFSRWQLVQVFPQSLHGTIHQTLNKCHQHRTAWLPVPGLVSLEISNINCWTLRCTLLYFSFGVKNVCACIFVNQIIWNCLSEMKTLLKQQKSHFPCNLVFVFVFCTILGHSSPITNFYTFYFCTKKLTGREERYVARIGFRPKQSEL